MRAKCSTGAEIAAAHALLNAAGMNDTILLHDIQHSIHALAQAVADVPTVAVALRRLAARLPQGGAETALALPRKARPARAKKRPAPLRPLLYRALEAGLLDARSFDHAMLVGRRATQVAMACERRPAYGDIAGNDDIVNIG